MHGIPRVAGAEARILRARLADGLLRPVFLYLITYSRCLRRQIVSSGRVRPHLTTRQCPKLMRIAIVATVHHGKVEVVSVLFLLFLRLRLPD